ncbi:hypothetical protein GJ496_009321 [Pomphorhynchus laevis]|nr:hypothetical protein GJ496_009321 [Pomphorhynchus laevis]
MDNEDNQKMDTYESQLQESIYNNDIDEVKRLIEQVGVDPNKEYNGRLPLYIACEVQSYAILEYLIDKCNVSVSSKNFFEETVLHVAIKYQNYEVAKLLIERGARINRADGDRIRPIHVAASLGCKDIVSLLLNNGAQLNVRDRNGYSPLHCALLNDHVSLVAYLIECGSDVNVLDQAGNSPIMIAAVRGLDLSVIELLIKSGADPNLVNKKGRSPLFSTIYHDHDVKISLYLLQAGSDFHFRDPFNDNYTLLHYACIHGRFELVQQLIELGLDVNYPSFSNETPLYVSVKRGFTEIAKYIISKGGDVNVMTKNAYDNYTPIHAAICYYTSLPDFIEVIDALVDAGANLTASENQQNDNNEFRPLVLLAMTCTKFSFASYLIAIGCEIENNTFVLGSALHLAFTIRQVHLMTQMYDAGINLSNEAWIHAYVYSNELSEIYGLEDLLYQFVAVTKEPRRLKDICRITIRNDLKAKGAGSLKNKIKKLNVAWGHKFYLLMNFSPFFCLVRDNLEQGCQPWKI